MTAENRGLRGVRAGVASTGASAGQRRYRAVDTVLDMLELFVSAGPEDVTVQRAVSKLGIEKSSASRLMARLAERGYLARLGPGRYVLGLRVLELSASAEARYGVGTACKRLLEKLAREVGRAAQLSVLDGEEGYVISTAESPAFPLRMRIPVGARVPLHATSAGRVLLAFSQVDRSSINELARFTENTLVDREALEEELLRVRELGYSVVRDEFFAGQDSISVPVMGRAAMAVAALTVIGPGTSSQAAGGSILKELSEAARRISVTLGHGFEEDT